MAFPKPQPVRVAVTLLYITLLIGVINGLINIYFVSATNSAAMAFPYGGVVAILVLLVATAILGFFYFKISQGRNWARILVLVLFILGLLYFVFSIVGMFQQGYLVPVISIVNTIIMLVAIILLFKQEASDWFKSNKQG